jgi:hypothetical protein
MLRFLDLGHMFDSNEDNFVTTTVSGEVLVELLSKIHDGN